MYLFILRQLSENHEWDTVYRVYTIRIYGILLIYGDYGVILIHRTAKSYSLQRFYYNGRTNDNLALNVYKLYTHSLCTVYYNLYVPTLPCKYIIFRKYYSAIFILIIISIYGVSILYSCVLMFIFTCLSTCINILRNLNQYPIIRVSLLYSIMPTIYIGT